MYQILPCPKRSLSLGHHSSGTYRSYRQAILIFYGPFCGFAARETIGAPRLESTITPIIYPYHVTTRARFVQPKFWTFDHSDGGRPLDFSRVLVGCFLLLPLKEASSWGNYILFEPGVHHSAACNSVPPIPVSVIGSSSAPQHQSLP
jgi:hypothetical protein